MNQSLTNRQIAFWIFGILVGYGNQNLPKVAAERSGTASWITILSTTSLVAILLYIVIYCGYVFKGKTIYEYGNILVGKYIASIFIAIYVIFYFFTAASVSRISCEVIKLTILLKTPVWALCLVLLLVSYYAVTKGIRTIGRICEYYVIIIILAYIFVHFLMLTEGKLVNLRPFFGQGNIFTYIKPSISMFIQFIGYETLTIVALNAKNGRRVFIYSLLMILFIGLFYTMIVESTIELMGVNDVIQHKDAILTAIRRLQVPYLEFLRRLDGVFMVAWTMSVFCSVMILIYSCVFLISKWFNKVNFNVTALIVTAMIYGAAVIPNKLETAESMLEYIGYFSLVPSALIPLIFFIIIKVKKYDKKKV